MTKQQMYKAAFEGIQAQPYDMGDKLLIRGLCHHSETHNAIVDCDDGVIYCDKCGVMSIDEYLKKAFCGGFKQEWIPGEIPEFYFNGANLFKVFLAEALGEIEIDGDLRVILKTLLLCYFANNPLHEDKECYFCGKRLTLNKTVVTNLKEKQTPWGIEISEESRNKYYWCYNNKVYERSEFFAAAFPEFNKVRKKVVFGETAKANLLRISTNQRLKLAYTILANKYNLAAVEDWKGEELLRFCQSNNTQTTTDTAVKLLWEDGLAKIVTFGLGLKPVGGEASMTWCYTVEETPGGVKYVGIPYTWESWRIRIEETLQRVVNEGVEINEAWNAVRPIVFCQGNKRMTLNTADRHRIFGYITQYLQNGYADFPLEGDIGDDYEFEINFDADCEIVDAVNIRSSEDMAAYNKENNVKNNAAKGAARVKNRFKEAFPNIENGDQLTTKQLNAAGYDKNAITRLCGTPEKPGVLKRLKRGVYVCQIV